MGGETLTFGPASGAARDSGRSSLSGGGQSSSSSSSRSGGVAVRTGAAQGAAGLARPLLSQSSSSADDFVGLGDGTAAPTGGGSSGSGPDGYGSGGGVSGGGGGAFAPAAVPQGLPSLGVEASQSAGQQAAGRAPVLTAEPLGVTVRVPALPPPSIGGRASHSPPPYEPPNAPPYEPPYEPPAAAARVGAGDEGKKVEEI